MKDQIRDKYEAFYHQEGSFTNALQEQQANTIEHPTPLDDLHFYASGDVRYNQDGSIDVMLERLDRGQIVSATAHFDDDAKDAALDTVYSGSKMFVQYGPGMQYLPVSDIAKLSLNGRSLVSFSGDISDCGLDVMALAKVYEDAIMKNCRGDIKIMEIYGKAQALMSRIYTPTSHAALFAKIKTATEEKLGEPLSFSNGIICHKYSRCEWKVHKYSNNNVGSVRGAGHDVNVRLSVQDSSTGYSGVVIAPVIAIDNNDVQLNNSWYSKHVSVSDADVAEGIEAALFDLENNAKRLIETQKIKIEHPEAYTENAIRELNRLAGAQKNAKLTKKIQEALMEEIASLSFALLGDVTLWDIVQKFWMVPRMAGTDKAMTGYQESLGRTVSKILMLNHSALDVK